MSAFRYLVLATLAAVGVLFGAGRASAHAMHVDVDHANDPVRVLAYFDEDLPAEFAEVTVTDADGTVVAAGKTDERGTWTFPRPTKPGTYVLVVKEPDGHRARREFTITGAAEEVVVPERRLNKWVGLSIGVGGLLGLSGVSWLLRRRGRRLE